MALDATDLSGHWCHYNADSYFGKRVATVDQSHAHFTDMNGARGAVTDQSHARFTDMNGASYRALVKVIISCYEYGSIFPALQ